MRFNYRFMMMQILPWKPNGDVAYRCRDSDLPGLARARAKTAVFSLITNKQFPTRTSKENFSASSLSTQAYDKGL